MPPTSRVVPNVNDKLLANALLDADTGGGVTVRATLRLIADREVKLGRLLVALHQNDPGEIQKTLNDLEAT